MFMVTAFGTGVVVEEGQNVSQSLANIDKGIEKIGIDRLIICECNNFKIVVSSGNLEILVSGFTSIL